jgi:hypothetical protein
MGFNGEHLRRHRDGKHLFLAESNARDRAELHVVLNWFEGLDRLVPTID